MNRVRYQIGFPQQLPYLPGLIAGPVEQIIPCIHNSDNIIDVLVIYRVSGQAGFPDGTHDHFVFLLQRKGNHIGLSCHGVPYRNIIEPEYILYPFLFLLINSALLTAQLHHHAYFLFRNRILFCLCFHMKDT